METKTETKKNMKQQDRNADRNKPASRAWPTKRPGAANMITSKSARKPTKRTIMKAQTKIGQRNKGAELETARK